ncbi:MAG TPA: galactokinase [Sphaerochaeta sp.]|nr:galactokinase [Sphaerochaeta sp.]
MDTIVRQHTEEFEAPPAVIVTVPGICTLLGGYADACRGWSLVATDEATLSVAISLRDDQMVRLYNATLNDRKRFNLSNVKFRKEDRWGNFPKGVIGVMVSEATTLAGMNITVSGELLYADNQMISTASALATTLAIDALFAQELSLTSTVRITYQANTVFNSERCRVSDLLAMINGAREQLLYFDLQHMTFQQLPLPFGSVDGDIQAIIIDSKISPAAMREEIEYKREEIDEAFAALSAQKGGAFLRDFSESDMSDRSLRLDEDQRQICSYILGETRMIRDAAKLFSERGASQLGKMLTNVQHGLRDRLEVTCPEVDWLTKRAGETPGVYGAVQVDNGFAGNILVLLSKDALSSYIERLEEYEHIFGFRPRWYLLSGSDAAKVVLR